MVRTQLAVAELLWNLTSGKTGNTGRVTFVPQKMFSQKMFPVSQDSGEKCCDEQTLDRATPESQGISSDYLGAFLDEIAHADRTDVHQVMVVRNEKVICECGFEPYPRGMWHVSYSLCKSITGMAIGFLIDEGKLNLQDRMIDFFKKRIRISTLRQKDITVEDLLIMKSCVDFNESGIVTGDDWVSGFLESGLSGTPKTDFEYNSMNSYMLSAIVTEVTGESMMEYLRPRLWEPLGIQEIFWESCPRGITKGGWGLFIRPEDVAKLGILYLNKGEWKGNQILSPKWVEMACQKHAIPPENMGRYGYGYHVWMGGRENSFNYNGMLGQNMIAYPDLNMLVVTNAGSSELFQNCKLMEIIKKYFETDFQPPVSLPENSISFHRLQNRIRRFEGEDAAFPVIRSGGWSRNSLYSANEVRKRRILSELDGRIYRMEDTHVGLMPILMQVFHNNYTDGITEIGFFMENDRFYISILEGEDRHVLQVGMRHAAVADVSFHGEIYSVALKGELTRDEDGRDVLKLDFAFLEEACRRRAKLFFLGENLEIRWDETPGKELILEGLELLTDTESRKSFMLNAMRDVGGIDLFQFMIERMVQPAVHAILMKN